ncbi:AbrB family transcriptional regulator [Burkholderia sp. RS02]|uniref:AbrB family transcriptional regulator n=1 Tax=unclassified Burkholderia TaxID=2613784 RepID=UPI0032185FCE
MHAIHPFRIGDSWVVSIPDELAYECDDIALEIERVGDELRIRPARRPLSGVLAKFAQFDAGMAVERLDEDGQGERELL